MSMCIRDEKGELHQSRELYFFRIIDILQLWTLRKVIESKTKSLLFQQVPNLLLLIIIIITTHHHSLHSTLPASALWCVVSKHTSEYVHSSLIHTHAQDQLSSIEPVAYSQRFQQFLSNKFVWVFLSLFSLSWETCCCCRPSCKYITS